VDTYLASAGNAGTGDGVTRERFGEAILMGWDLTALLGDKSQLLGKDGVGTNTVSMTQHAYC